MRWPLSQDYNEAIQLRAHSFGDPELRCGQPVVNTLGLPMPLSGNFSDVYQYQGASGSLWALKCFTREVPDLQERYTQISQHLSQARLPFSVDFTYLPKGIRIAQGWYPLLKMRWIEGRLLNDFVRKYAERPHVLESLCRVWQRTSGRLRQAGIAHADLQHGNIILVRRQTGRAVEVKLIDYDGMWLPNLANKTPGEWGHPAYQHPERVRQRLYTPAVDNFSHLVIYTALRAVIIAGKEIWTRFDNGDNLLFRQQDFEAPTRSRLFAELLRLNDAQLHRLTVALIDAARQPLAQTPPLEALLPRLPDSDTVPDVPVRGATRVEPPLQLPVDIPIPEERPLHERFRAWFAAWKKKK